MATIEEARAAKQKLLSQLPKDPIIGVGISGNKDGYFVAARVQAHTVPEGLPASVDGVDVEYVAVGKIKSC